MRNIVHPRTFALFCVFSLMVASLPLFNGCTTQTTQAATFATLQSAAAGIDSFRASYENAYSIGAIDTAKKVRCDEQYNRANEAIIVAARAARDGMNATTPAEVDQAVASFIAFVTTIIPPKPRN